MSNKLAQPGARVGVSNCRISCSHDGDAEEDGMMRLDVMGYIRPVIASAQLSNIIMQPQVTDDIGVCDRRR
jgi:hypothetical protein